MRILLITEYLPASDRGEVTGGIEAYVHYMTAHLRRDHEVVVLARSTHDGSVWDAATIRSLPGRLWFLLRAFVRGVRSEWDVVIGCTFVVHPIAWLVGKVRRRPVVFWYPDVLIGDWLNGHFGKVAGVVGELTERILLRLSVDRFIAISESTASKLRKYGVPVERVAVVPCGFEPAAVASIDTAAPSALGPTFVVVGRVVPYKRVDVLVRAAGLLRERHPTLRLIVIGQGPERPRLERLARELCITQHVHFRGFVDRHVDVLTTVAGSIAYVSASEIEGFGIALVEAMALGVPYVVSDIGAFREVTGGGVGGELVTPGRPEEFAAAMHRLIEHPQERERLAREGHEHVQRYTWSSVAGQTVDVLESAIAERASRRRGPAGSANAPCKVHES